MYFAENKEYELYLIEKLYVENNVSSIGVKNNLWLYFYDHQYLK